MRLRGQSDSVGPSEKAILSPPKGKAGKTIRAKTPTSKSILDKAKHVLKARAPNGRYNAFPGHDPASSSLSTRHQQMPSSKSMKQSRRNPRWPQEATTPDSRR